jgi:methionyl-tRNA formyltransferase
MIKTVFFGTHKFAVSILQSLIDSGDFDIQLVVTRPDMPVGREKKIEKTPVKILAEKYNLKIAQPENLKNFNALNDTEINTEINIVCQYGEIIPQNIINAPKYKSINIHTSLLPKYRGASPIQSAIINGERTTGVTIMIMDEKMDHGPILTQKETVISDTDDYESLSEKMSKIAGELLISTAQKWINDQIQPRKQNDDEATYCKILTRDDGKINDSQTADEIYNLYRGLNPWPGIWTIWNGKRLKFLEIKKTSKTGEKGQIKNEDGHLIYFCAGNSAIEILRLQIEGKKPMDAKTFCNGYLK